LAGAEEVAESESGEEAGEAMRMNRGGAVALSLFERLEEGGAIDGRVDPADALLVGVKEVKAITGGKQDIEMRDAELVSWKRVGAGHSTR
jgi:hypothetical protein